MTPVSIITGDATDAVISTKWPGIFFFLRPKCLRRSVAASRRRFGGNFVVVAVIPIIVVVVVAAAAVVVVVDGRFGLRSQ